MGTEVIRAFLLVRLQNWRVMEAIKEGLLCAKILLGILFVMGDLASVTASLYLVQCKIDASGSMTAYDVTFCN